MDDVFECADFSLGGGQHFQQGTFEFGLASGNGAKGGGNDDHLSDSDRLGWRPRRARELRQRGVGTLSGEKIDGL